MRGEKIARASHRQSLGKRLPRIFHVTARALQHRESGVAFVQMADLGMNAQRPQKPPPGDAQNPLLL
jgi:hypothetical protein